MSGERSRIMDRILVAETQRVNARCEKPTIQTDMKFNISHDNSIVDTNTWISYYRFDADTMEEFQFENANASHISARAYRRFALYTIL